MSIQIVLTKSICLHQRAWVELQPFFLDTGHRNHFVEVYFPLNRNPSAIVCFLVYGLKIAEQKLIVSKYQKPPIQKMSGLNHFIISASLMRKEETCKDCHCEEHFNRGPTNLIIQTSPPISQMNQSSFLVQLINQIPELFAPQGLRLPPAKTLKHSII